ncbi:uncharacterized protein [Argopecten irradians]|uniref:uncharacterized protein isoform X2 n=1 Tax=Argopecten irradians TaxID=31199 RepID=UPI003721303C
MGVGSSLFGFLVFLLSTQHTTAIRCLSCNDVIQPRHCSRIEYCPDGDSCVTESYENRNGELLYNVGCMSSQRCSLSSSRNSSADLQRAQIVGTHVDHICTECCHGDMCNAAGCGTQGFPQQRGPICLNCPQTRNPAYCDVISICLQEEVCHVEEILEFGDVFYRTGCLRKSNHRCNLPLFNPVEIGRRSGRSNNCFFCCKDDLCNDKCYNPTPSSSASTELTSHVSATHTTVTLTTPMSTTESTSTVTSPRPCKDGWIASSEKCYFVSTEKTNWATAVTRCASFGAKLAEIETDMEGRFLNQAMPSRIDELTYIYIGYKWNDADEWVFASSNMTGNTWPPISECLSTPLVLFIPRLH